MQTDGYSTQGTMRLHHQVKEDSMRTRDIEWHGWVVEEKEGGGGGG